MRRAAFLLSIVALAAQWTLPGARAGGSWPGAAGYSVPVATLDAALECKTPIDGSGRAQPVLLVHGTGFSREQSFSWNYWRALPRDGFEVCWVQLPQAALGDIQIASEYVARGVEVMHERTGELVDILGHSQGGLEPRWAIKYFPAGVWVDDYVALASPNHGTLSGDPCEVTRYCAPSFWQMRRGSDLVGALNAGDETPGPISYTDVYTRFDHLVRPPRTAALDGGRNILLQHVCPGRPVEHVGLVDDAIVYDLAVDAFTRPGPAHPAIVSAADCLRESRIPGSTLPPLGQHADYSDAHGTTHEPPLQPYAR